jgi:hypothetical protein
MLRTFAASALLVLLAACGGSANNPSGTPLVGNYTGEIAIATTGTTGSIFTSAVIKIANDGKVTGTLTTASPTSVIENGTISGTLSGSELTLSMQFATLGSYTAKGPSIYTDITRKLAAQIPAKNASGTVIGQALIILDKE